MKKKIFSREKFIASMRSNRFVSNEHLQEIINATDDWSNNCDGLTEEEIKKLHYFITDDWMIEVENGEI